MLISQLIENNIYTPESLSKELNISRDELDLVINGDHELPNHQIRALETIMEIHESPQISKAVKSINNQEVANDFLSQLRAFDRVGRKTTEILENDIRYFINDYWTAKQRKSNNLHEISYRACFKAELPNFFINRLTRPGDVVLDPFMGRGTTLLEANLNGRSVAGNDINPLSKMLIEPRLFPPSIGEIVRRLDKIDLSGCDIEDENLTVFFHEDTLRKLYALRQYFIERTATGQIDLVDKWIRMVALNRLTGHSSGFFSVYTLPPNQATTIERQRRINLKRNQEAEPKDIKKLIIRKSKSLLKDVHNANNNSAVLTTGHASKLGQISDNSISLVVTSPPFLDIVDYAGDNWMRAWFAGFDVNSVDISIHKSIEDWTEFTSRVLHELFRVVKPGGFVAYEVGEVRNGKVKLEEQVIQASSTTDFKCLGVMINDQKFSKTANAWGVSNNSKGTNTNRIVMLEKPR